MVFRISHCESASPNWLVVRTSAPGNDRFDQLLFLMGTLQELDEVVLSGFAPTASSRMVIAGPGPVRHPPFDPFGNSGREGLPLLLLSVDFSA